VRTWLVVLGVVIAALGTGLILTLFALSPGTAITTRFTVVDPTLGGHLNQTWVVPGSGAGSIAVTWTTSSGANVSLWSAVSCSAPTGFCPTGMAALSWSLASSGTGTVSSPNASTYILVVTNPASAPLRFDGTVSVTYGPNPILPTWSWGLIALGGLALLVIGGIAVFLGVFLPGGVYRDPDAEMVAVRHPSLEPEEFDTESDEGPP
jgi:hypothetical protein